MWFGDMGLWMILAGLWGLIFWGGLIALMVWGFFKLRRQDGSAPERNPLEIAKERYAKGELSKEEFEQLKKDLS